MGEEEDDDFLDRIGSTLKESDPKLTASDVQRLHDDLQEQIKVAAEWFNAFGDIESWMLERGLWTEDDIDTENPANTLIRGLERLYAAKERPAEQPADKE